MSNTFAGSTTRAMGKFEREVETKLKKLDVFTDDFSPPGASEITKGQDTSKGNEYQAPHSDPTPKNDMPSKGRTLAASGKASDQGPLDAMDEHEQRTRSGVKAPSEQFPLGATLDRLEKRLVHLKKEIKHDFGISEANAREWIAYANQKAAEMLRDGKVDQKTYEGMLKENQENYKRRISGKKLSEEYICSQCDIGAHERCRGGKCTCPCH